jgi:hypothetical protein
MFLICFFVLSILLASANGYFHSVDQNIENLERAFEQDLASIQNTIGLNFSQKQHYSSLLFKLFVKELEKLRALKKQENLKFLEENKKLLNSAKSERQYQIENHVYKNYFLPKQKGSFLKDFHTIRY